MKSHAARFAISMPRDLYRAVEAERRRRGASRSAVFQAAIRRWLQAAERDRELRRYEDGYRQYPEREEEIGLHGRLAAQVLHATEWD